MSDYMYLLESHVSGEQNQLLTATQKAAAELGIALYLTGGAMRDMLGGYPIRDLDFTWDGPAPQAFARLLKQRLPGLELIEDAPRKTIELKLANGVTGSLRMAHVETVSRPGGTPKSVPTDLLKDLSRRDFTVDAIAISLAPASRGLIRDPVNGVSDLRSRELRVCYPQAFFDRPSRLLRAIRLKHRLGFQIEERTQRLLENGVAEGWHKLISSAEWKEELRLISEANEPSEILRELDARQLLPLPLDALNIAALARFEKLRRMIPGRAAFWPLFLHVIVDEVKPKQRAAVAHAFELTSAELDAAKKIKARAAKLLQAVKSPSLRRPSHVYQAVSPAAPAEVLYLLYDSDQRLVQDRLRNYFEKYLPAASEITDAQVEATGVKPGTPQFQKAKASLIAARLNAHAAPPPPPGQPVPGAHTPSPNAPQIAPRDKAAYGVAAAARGRTVTSK